MKYCETQGVTLTEVGEFLGKRKQTISGWKRGVSRPSIDDLLKLCEFLEVSPNEILGFKDQNALAAEMFAEPEARYLPKVEQLEREIMYTKKELSRADRALNTTEAYCRKLEEENERLKRLSNEGKETPSKAG